MPAEKGQHERINKTKISFLFPLYYSSRRMQDSAAPREDNYASILRQATEFAQMIATEESIPTSGQIREMALERAAQIAAARKSIDTYDEERALLSSAKEATADASRMGLFSVRVRGTPEMAVAVAGTRGIDVGILGDSGCLTLNWASESKFAGKLYMLTTGGNFVSLLGDDQVSSLDATRVERFKTVLKGSKASGESISFYKEHAYRAAMTAQHEYRTQFKAAIKAFNEAKERGLVSAELRVTDLRVAVFEALTSPPLSFRLEFVTGCVMPGTFVMPARYWCIYFDREYTPEEAKKGRNMSGFNTFDAQYLRVPAVAATPAAAGGNFSFAF
jgi:hypothetical protein